MSQPAKKDTSAKESQKSSSAEMDARLKSLTQFASTMNKKWGDESVMVGGEATSVPRISTGVPEIDGALGGGFPQGRIIEIFGPEASGKSTICWSTIADIQRNGGMVGYVDVEHALDNSYLSKMGVDLAKMAISQPDTAETALSIVEDMIDTGLFDMIVVDSVAALVPKKELEGEMGDAQMGAMARLMSQALRKLTGKVAKSKTVLVFINQLRMKIGVMYGNPETTTGGNALKFYASVRLDVRRIEPIKDGEKVIGQKMNVKTVKNKTATPGQKVEVSLIYGKGFDQITGVYEEAVLKKILTKAGGRHYWMGDKAKQMAASRSEMVIKMQNDENLLLEIKNLNATTEVPTEEAAS
jgi:recombination protein RecA